MNDNNTKQDIGMKEILTMLGELPYPKEFLEKYDIYKLLAEKNGTETFLAKGKSDGKKYIVKCYDSSMRSFTNENELLKGLSHKGLPVYVDSYSSDRALISVREYVEGKPLDQLAVGNPFSANHAASIISRLCDILTYLHERPEPIIHRDIKPNNIIVKPDGSIVLIDFDIARRYRDDAERDTGLLATPGYAPPEQYGFSQTDTRSDIYAMGVLLRWLLTGDEKPSENDGIPSGLRRIIDKCTAFSPDDRYGSAEEVKDALARRNSGRSKSAAGYIIAPVLCLLMFGAGFLTGRNTPRQESAGITPAVSATETEAPDAAQDNAIEFKEPLIEQSVRLQVGKTNGEPLTEEDLRSVSGVYIDGTHAMGSYDEAANHSFDGVWGDISTLEDIKMLPSAWDVLIKHQTLDDISALENQFNIKNLWLDNVFVKDYSVLETMPYLESVFLNGTPVEDLSVFDKLPRLRDVYLSDTLIPVEKICGRDSVRLLCLSCRHFDSFEGLVGFDKLETFIIDFDVTANCSFEPLSKLPSLKTIRTTPELAEELEKELKGTGIEIVY